MNDTNSDFQSKVKKAINLKSNDGFRECYGMSNPAKFVPGGFLCGIPNIENLEMSAEALCVFSKIQLSPHSELHTAIVIKKNLASLLARTKEMATSAGDFFSDKNNNCALFLLKDGNIYAYNKAKEIELNDEIIKKLQPGVAPDALYWAVYGNETDAAGGLVSELGALISPDKFMRINSPVVAIKKTDSKELRSAFIDLCKFCSEYHVSAEPWMRNNPKVQIAQQSLSQIKTWLEANYGEYGGTHFKVEVAEGATNFPKVPWVCLLPPGQAASDGVFVSICFGREGAGAVAGFAESVRNRRGLKFVKRSETHPLRVDVNGASPGTYYNDSFENPIEFLAKDFDETKFAQHISASLDRCLSFLRLKKEMPFTSKQQTDFISDLRTIGFQCAPALPAALLSSLLSKPFVILTGLAGSGKTKLAQAFANWITPKSDNEEAPNPNYALIPVGADWTGSENVLGYPNGLDTKSYVSKPALDVILHARQHLNSPHFLILDEMNLSHVERYFADILSMIESQEAITLYCDKKGSDGQPENTRSLEPVLKLPDNLFIIGTVNVDETTYMFSPKVLDRANVIEFRVTEREMAGFLSDLRKPDIKMIRGNGASFGPGFLNLARNKTATVPSEVKDRFCAEMNLFFALQREHGGEYGFRVAHEASRFLHFYKLLGDGKIWDATAEAGNGAWAASVAGRDWFDAAFDALVIQKFLPKLHGSKVKLGPLLRKINTACIEAHNAAPREEKNITAKLVDPARVVQSDARYPVSAEKIFRMWRQLNENGFTSFPEN